MNCPECQTENTDDASTCVKCGTTLHLRFDTDRIRAQLEKWRERLLDLTKRNPLLGINRSRVSKLRIAHPDVGALFGELVMGEATLKMPRVVKISRSKIDDSGQEEANEKEYEIEAGDIMFEASAVDLLRRLRRLYDNARTSVEERGVTTLHLAFGVLKWEDPLLGASVSPLWLVPCELESFGPNAPMRLAMSDEEMQLNPAVELYLRDRHRITLPSLPEEPSAETFAGFMKAVGDAVREHGWSVEEDAWLSTYSFESLVLYQDLRAMTDAALSNSVVASLAHAMRLREASEALGEEALDTLPCPDQVPIPALPTDSSQLHALTVARTGRHLVIHGPPGTGKSQTIVNLIADALARNQKVLFVSAKIAALNVVHDRLTRLGLDQFCLEAHSTKAGKAKIMEELKRTLSLASQPRQDTLDEHLEDLLRIREELNAYVRELHESRQPLGLSLYKVMGKVERLCNEPDIRGHLPWDNPLKVSRLELNLALEVLADLGSQSDVFDARSTHPWRGLTLKRGEIFKPQLIEEDLLRLRETVRKISADISILTGLAGWTPASLTLEVLSKIQPVLSDLATLDTLPPGWATRNVEDLSLTAALLDTAAGNAADLKMKTSEHESALKLSAGDALRVLAPTESHFRSRARVLRVSYWIWKRSIREYFKEGVTTNFGALQSYFAVAGRVRELEQWFDDHRDALSAETGLVGSSNPEIFKATARSLYITARLQTVCSYHGLPSLPVTTDLSEQMRRSADSIARTVLDSGVNETIQRLSRAWPDAFVDGVSLVDTPIPALLARCEEILANIPKIHEWTVLQHTLEKCTGLGLMRFVDGLGSVSVKHARVAFERCFYIAWANAVLQLSSTLAMFAGVRREEQVTRFQEIDAKISRAALSRIKAIASGRARRVGDARDIAGTESEVAILRRELEKRKKLKPLRKLFGEIPNVLQALKPCMLMSPLSVSTFLKPGTVSFDLIVFDEASQLPPQEAIPAILRAKQVVVAGDEKQLPPTSFFKTSIIFDEADEEEGGAEALEPLESLLDECVASFPFFDRTHLRWHYRSKDERLIKFSNHFFYREKPLITFPSVSRSTVDRGVRLEYVPDGVWDRGGSKTNRVEARRIVELVIQQLGRFPERSLGIVAMNVTQREAIMDALDEVMLSRPDLQPLLDPRRPESFFVKALENVQGDERDTIIISVGYGKSSAGSMTFNFGPLNQEGGWRRLNVLVTRSRWQTILVTSLRSQELGGINPNNRGAVELRNFIAYAEREGELPPDTAILTEEETNDFEDAVAEGLKQRGLDVDQQVGASEYRIDMAIRDPRDRNRYLLGVECDGATYHSARTARDRDLLRQEVLREQGWRLYRIWSTDWFRDREKAIAGLLRAVEKALATPVEDSVQAPPRSSSQHSGSVPTDEVSSTNEPTKDQRGSTARRFRAGVRYEKFSGKGNRTLLLEPDEVRRLANQIVTIVNFEGPIHIDMLSERLKELNGIARAGANILDNVRRAIEIAVRSAQLERMDGDFLKRKGHIVDTFRIAGDGVERPLPYVPPEEIRAAVLYIVEDQFGYQREALPRAVSKLLGFDRTAEGTAEIVGTIVDDLIERGALAVSGPNVYLR